MNNENKNKLSDKQLGQVSGGNFPSSYGDKPARFVAQQMFNTHTTTLQTMAVVM